MPDNQLGLFTGEALKDEGRSRVEENSGGWVCRMRDHAVEMALEQGSVNIDALRIRASINEDYPHSPNAWGAIFRGKGWKIIGYEKSRIPSNHARRIAI